MVAVLGGVADVSDCVAVTSQPYRSTEGSVSEYGLCVLSPWIECFDTLTVFIKHLDMFNNQKQQDTILSITFKVSVCFKYSPAWSASIKISSIFTLTMFKVIFSTSWLIFFSLSVTLLTEELEAEAAVFADSIRPSVSPEIKKQRNKDNLQCIISYFSSYKFQTIHRPLLVFLKLSLTAEMSILSFSPFSFCLFTRSLWVFTVCDSAV